MQLRWVGGEQRQRVEVDRWTRLRAHGGTLPEGTREPKQGPEQGKKRGPRTPLRPSPFMGPPSARSPASSGPLLPSSPGPHAASRSPRLRPPSPSRPLSSASSQTPPPPSSARRRDTTHAPHTQDRREMESSLRSAPASTSCLAGCLPPSPILLSVGLHFRPSSVMPSGKCSLWQRRWAERGSKGFWEMEFAELRSPGRLVGRLVGRLLGEAHGSWRWSVALMGSKQRP